MKGLASIFAALLTLCGHGVPSTPAHQQPLTSLAPVAMLNCWNDSVDVSLQISIRNQGPDDLPAGTLIAYSYQMSAGGVVKNGSYKIDATLKSGETRSFLVSPLQSWYPPIYQCRARVLKVKKSSVAKRQRS